MHELDVEVAWREARREPPERFAGASRSAREHRTRRLAVQAAGERDEPLGVRLEVAQGHDARLVRPAQMVLREQPAQVAVAREVPAEQREVVARGRRAPESHARRQQEAPLGRQVGLAAQDARRLHDDLAADDRPDARRMARLVEPDRTREPLVVGERERGHLEFGRTCDERRQRRRTVHEAELRMNVKVHESGGHRKDPT